MAASDWIDDMIERFVKRERERCAKIADAEAADAQEQIEKNNKYLKETGGDDQSCNDLCRHRKSGAERIAAAIRNAR